LGDVDLVPKLTVLAAHMGLLVS